MTEQTFPFPPPGPPPVVPITEILASVAPFLVLLGMFFLLLWRNTQSFRRFEALCWGLMALVLGVVLACADNQSDRYAAWVLSTAISLCGLAFALWRKRLRRAVPGALVIAGLAGALVISMASLPPRLNAREAPKRSSCKTNLRQLGRILLDTAAHTGGLPPSQSDEPARSWRVQILPLAGQHDLRTQYDDRSPWDHVRNAEVAANPPSLFLCPTNFNPRDATGRGFTAYAAITGEHAAMSTEERRPTTRITDGTSNTVLLIEACGREIVWTEPRDIDLASTPVGINLNGPTKTSSPGAGSSYHAGGCQVVLADGSVRFISQNIDATTLKRLLTADDSEEIGEF